MGVGRGDDHFVDQLGIRIDGHVRLVPVETAVAGLMAVTGLAVNGRDHSVAGDPRDNSKHAVVVGSFAILAVHDRQQLGGLGRRPLKRLSVERCQRRKGVTQATKTA